MLRVFHKLFRILKPFYLRILIISIVFNHRVEISYSSQAFKTFLTNSAHLLSEWNSVLALKKVFYSVRNYLVLQKDCLPTTRIRIHLGLQTLLFSGCCLKFSYSACQTSMLTTYYPRYF